MFAKYLFLMVYIVTCIFLFQFFFILCTFVSLFIHVYFHNFTLKVFIWPCLCFARLDLACVINMWRLILWVWLQYFSFFDSTPVYTPSLPPSHCPALTDIPMAKLNSPSPKQRWQTRSIKYFVVLSGFGWGAFTSTFVKLWNWNEILYIYPCYRTTWLWKPFNLT